MSIETYKNTLDLSVFYKISALFNIQFFSFKSNTRVMYVWLWDLSIVQGIKLKELNKSPLRTFSLDESI